MFKEIIIIHGFGGKVKFHLHLTIVIKINLMLKKGLKAIKTKLEENMSEY